MPLLVDDQTIPEILVTVGARMRVERLNQNLTRAELAKRSGVSVTTISRCEHGGNVATESLVRMMRGLNTESRLDAAFPDTAPSPLDVVERGNTERQRATGRRASGKRLTEVPW